MGTIVVGLVVVFCAGCAIRKMVKDKKNGKSPRCGGNCGHCGRRCQ